MFGTFVYNRSVRPLCLDGLPLVRYTLIDSGDVDLSDEEGSNFEGERVYSYLPEVRSKEIVGNNGELVEERRIIFSD